jgi:hypothetical protein
MMQSRLKTADRQLEQPVETSVYPIESRHSGILTIVSGWTKQAFLPTAQHAGQISSSLVGYLAEEVTANSDF